MPNISLYLKCTFQKTKTDAKLIFFLQFVTEKKKRRRRKKLQNAKTKTYKLKNENVKLDLHIQEKLGIMC